MGEFIANLKSFGWHIEPPAAGAEIPEHLIARYGALFPLSL
jgi:hypothetical protein